MTFQHAQARRLCYGLLRQIKLTLRGESQAIHFAGVVDPRFAPPLKQFSGRVNKGLLIVFGRGRRGCAIVGLWGVGHVSLSRISLRSHSFVVKPAKYGSTLYASWGKARKKRHHADVEFVNVESTDSHVDRIDRSEFAVDLAFWASDCAVREIIAATVMGSPMGCRVSILQTAAAIASVGPA